MRPAIALFALALTCHALPVLAQKETPTIDGGAIKITKVTVKVAFPLKFITSDDAAAKLSGKKPGAAGQAAVSTLPPGIDKIVSYPRTNLLFVEGESDAVTKLKKTVSEIDVATPGIRIELKVLRFEFDADGAWDVQTVGNSAIITLDNSPATISVQGGDDGYTVSITPHKNADGTISVKGELRAGADHTAFRRDTPGRAGGIVAGVSNSHSTAVRKAAASGRIPSVKGEPYTIYYLQIVSVK